MKATVHNRNAGFTLVEMLVAFTLGMLVVGAAVQLFSSAMGATLSVQQKAEMQQDVRAASNLLRQDISLAGAGIPQVGIALASGTPNLPRYGCAGTQCFVGPNGSNGNGLLFPANTLYGIIPGWQQGIAISGQKTDVITLGYTDATLPLNCYLITLPAADPTKIVFTTPPAGSVPSNCPTTDPAKIPSLSDPVLGLKAGDLILLQDKSSTSGNTQYAVGEVTSSVTGTSPFTVQFANNDPLLLNQLAATSGDMVQAAAGVTGSGTASRLLLITYYLDLCTSACGSTTGIPRLMRMVGGHPPQVVAENVTALAFTYDTYNSAGALLAQAADAGASLGVTPNEIRSVNIAHLSIRSPLPGSHGYQGEDIQASISARNMAFQNRYQ